MRKFIFGVITMFAAATALTACGHKATEENVGEGVDTVEVVEVVDSLTPDSVVADSTVCAETEVAE